MASLLSLFFLFISLSSATTPSLTPAQILSPSPSPSLAPAQSHLPSPSFRTQLLPTHSPSPSPSISLPSPSTSPIVQTSSPTPSPTPITQISSPAPSPTPITQTPSPTPAPSPSSHSTAGLNEIQKACRATRFPELCESSLSNQLPPKPNPLQILQSSVSVTIKNLRTAQSMVQSVLQSAIHNPNHTLIANNCLEILNNSYYRISSANDFLVNRTKIKDARIWTSAALTFEYGCRSGLKKFNDSKLIQETATFMDSVVDLTSNALSMMSSYDIFGDDTGLWEPPKTERDGFWKGANTTTSSSGNSSPLSHGFGLMSEGNVTVCKDRCNYMKIQDAINAAPDNGTDKFVIKIEEGLYEESVKVGLWKKNVVFLGEGMMKTIITGHLNVDQHGISTYNTATVGVLGDGFMAINLTIENTAGFHNPNASQAVALRLDSDKSFIENCQIIGFQDTLYAHTLRQFYKSCHIHGTIDFIFGSSATIFQNCEIVIEPRWVEPEKGETNVIAAHGRFDPAEPTGFVFENCTVKGSIKYMVSYNKNPSVHQTYLGRPWKEYARTVFINCNLEGLVSPQGWMEWDGDFGLKTLFFGEYKSSGRGARASERVPWSSKIPAEHLNVYSVQNFIQGDEWIPATSS